MSETSHIVEAILGLVYIGLVLTLIISIVCLRLTLDRRVRENLPKSKIYNAFPDLYFGFGRTVMFGCAALFDYANNAVLFRSLYDDFDVKSFANRYEKLLAFLMYSSLLFLLHLLLF